MASGSSCKGQEVPTKCLLNVWHALKFCKATDTSAEHALQMLNGQNHHTGRDAKKFAFTGQGRSVTPMCYPLSYYRLSFARSTRETQEDMKDESKIIYDPATQKSRGWPNFAGTKSRHLVSFQATQAPQRKGDDKDPSVSVVSEKSLTMSDGDQLQAKAGLPVLTCISQTPSEPGGSPPLLCFTYFNTV